jgi:hypothetical protein
MIILATILSGLSLLMSVARHKIKVSTRVDGIVS